MKLDFRQRLLTTTLLVGAGVLANPAYAQDSTQSTVPDQNQATNPGAAPPTGPVESNPTPTTSAQGKPVQTVNDIIITGTRIPQPNLQSQAPVTVVTNQDIKLQGTTRVEDMLNSLPSVDAEQSSGVSNAATGSATVDLRGLGSKRTLVLVNGRRVVPGDPFLASSADLNFIPASLVKRVDVLTGGASSTYGADAVSGVVNFIMDTGFSGIRFDGNYGFYQHNNGNSFMTNLLDKRANAGFTGFSYPRGSVVDGGSFDGTVSIGAGFDDNRGHALAYFGYRKVKPVLGSRRDYSACVLQLANATTPQCGGSLTNPLGTVIYHAPTPTTTTGSGAPTPNALFNATSTIGLLSGNGPGTFPTGGAAVLRYNFAPLNYYQRPDERYTAGVFANYEISPAIKPYMEFMFMDDRTLAQIAESGDFGNTLTVNCDNPLLNTATHNTVCTPYNEIAGFLGTFPLSAGVIATQNGPIAAGAPLPPPINFIDPTDGHQYQQAFFQLLRRNVEGGPRIADLQHTEWRGLLGTRGDLDPVWSYDAYFQYGRTDYAQTYLGEFSVARLKRALDVVSVDPTTGKEVAPGTLGSVPECRSFVTGDDPTCVPYDTFSGAGPSAAAVAYLTTPGFERGQTGEQVADINFTGNLANYGIKTPWADDGVGVNLGTEYRKESLELHTDAEFQAGDLSGQGAPTLPISGSYRVLEMFGEIQIPIVQHGFFDDLSVNAGYRKSYYKLMTGRSFNTDTYKIAAEFAPIHDIRFRGAYNRAVRAPNIQELFATQFVGLDGGTDPCAGFTISATDYGCLAEGLHVGQTVVGNPAAQYNGRLGGNPDLNPEVATTKTVGVVVQPRFIPRLALTVDWYDIKIKDAIQTFGADAILKQCNAGSTATVTDPACALVIRNPANGSLWLTSDGYVIDLPHNIGSLETKGFEFSGAYSHRLGGLGTGSLSFLGTWLKHYTVDNGLSAVYDCAGYYGQTCSGFGAAASAPLPKWRHKLRGTLQTPIGAGISLQWRYVGPVTIEYLNPSPTLNDFAYDLSSHIKGQNYFDLATTFTVGDHYNLRMGVNNIFDREPPLIHSGDASGNHSNCPTGPCNNNSYPGTWDALGRYFYVGATLDF